MTEKSVIQHKRFHHPDTPWVEALVTVVNGLVTGVEVVCEVCQESERVDLDSVDGPAEAVADTDKFRKQHLYCAEKIAEA